LVHKYVLTNEEMETNPGLPGDGTPTTPTVGTPLAGITFNVYPVNIGANGVYPASGTVKLNDYANPTSFTDSATPANTFTVGAAVTPQTTGTNGLAAFNGLSQGIYLVVEQSSNLVDSPSAPFVVAVPMVNPTGDGWLTDVNVYPKNEKLFFEKTVDASAVKVGDPVAYTLTPQVPSSIDSAQAYSVKDQLDPSLNFVSVTNVIAATSQAGLASGTALTEGTDYNVTTTGGPGGETVTITLTQAGMDKLAAGDGTLSYLFMQATLNTTVNSGILAAGTVGNQAEIDFTNQYDENKVIQSTNPNDPDNPNGTTDIHTATITVDKIDAATANNATPTKLAGAQFQIASSQANADAGNFLKKDANGVILDVGDTGYAAASDWIITTDTSGIVTATNSFQGLIDYTGAYGDTANPPAYLSYYLVETKAPATYNLLPGSVTITFGAATSDPNNASFTNYLATKTVGNNKGFTLPQTGGAGTIAFTVIGIALVGAAVILLVATKKKKGRKAAAQ